MNFTNFNGKGIVDACVMNCNWNPSGKRTRTNHLPFYCRCRHPTIQTLAYSSTSRWFGFLFDGVNVDISVVEQRGIWVSEANCQIPNGCAKSERMGNYVFGVCVITSNDRSFGCPIMYTYTIHNAILLIDTSTIIDTTKADFVIGKP